MYTDVYESRFISFVCLLINRRLTVHMRLWLGYTASLTGLLKHHSYWSRLRYAALLQSHITLHHIQLSMTGEAVGGRNGRTGSFYPHQPPVVYDRPSCLSLVFCGMLFCIMIEWIQNGFTEWFVVVRTSAVEVDIERYLIKPGFHNDIWDAICICIWEAKQYVWWSTKRNPTAY